MLEVIIAGNDVTPDFVLKVNGEDTSGQVGVPVTVTAAEYEALMDSHLADDVTLVPPDPVVLLDFKNGDYSIGGVTKTLGEVCEQNLNWGSFSASDVVAGVGYIQENGDTGAGPVLSAAAYAAVGNEFVAVTHYKYEIGAAVDKLSISLGTAALPSYANYCSWVVGETFYDQSLLEDETGVILDLADAGYSNGVHRLAARFAATQLAVSIDGGAVASATTTNQSGSTAVAFWINCTGSTDSAAVIEKVEFYALSDFDSGDLPALSR